MTTWAETARPPTPDVFERIGRAILRLFTSVDFAVVQIIGLSLLALVGMTIKQLPTFALRSAGDYANAMADLHARYDPAFGRGIVDALERLQLFHVFTSTWFTVGLIVLVISIVICTLDRTPRLWRQSKDIRVVQPDAFYDPELLDRAALTGVEAGAVRAALRRQRFVVREAEVDGVQYLYGDRHRWTKLATLLSHMGLILFLVAGVVTWQFGDEQGLIVAEGDTLTVQPIGTPGLLLVKNYDFEAPGFLETGQASDFTTDLGVFQNGTEIARKTIRVNDPLEIGGYNFHENGFGAAPELLISDAAGKPLWDGPVPLTDMADGLPYGTLSVPGRDIGLSLLLKRDADGIGVVIVAPYRMAGVETDGSPKIEYLDQSAIAVAAGEAQVPFGLDFSVGVRRFSDYVLLIAKKDPGQGIVWTAFLLLIIGLAITFYLPRRRIWARIAPSGELRLVARSDRYVDLEREFGLLLDDLVARRVVADRAAPAG
ncbi:MAG TPA: cytochrome c biogenesis protein ResB [Candidatus Limnocylindrales bacterium]|nr:cytochrome c biogenesis protein ResB [Candidatus Limnocylindrales bacterium]